MNPSNPVPPQPPRSEQQSPPANLNPGKDQQLDQELDQELNDTFPASDPLPWSHEVK